MADARLDADRALVQFLAERHFAGPSYRRFEEEIVRYGIAVIGAWLRTKWIFDKCRGIGVELPWPAADWSSDDRDELTWETVGRGAVKLRSRLIAGAWDPSKGAALNTYFITGCLYEFRELYLSWHRYEHRHRFEVVDDLDDQRAETARGPAQIAEDRDQARRGLHAVSDPRVQAALVLQSDGYTHAEIAHLLGDGLTAKAVEGMLYRHRRKFGEGGGERA